MLEAMLRLLEAASALVPRRVPLFRCMREEQSLSTLTLHDQWPFVGERVPP